MSYSIGVDLGGTNIKIVVISNDGNVLDYLTCDTADSEGLCRKQSNRKSTRSKISAASHLVTSVLRHPVLRLVMVDRSLTCRAGLRDSRDSCGSIFWSRLSLSLCLMMRMRLYWAKSGKERR